MEKISNFEKEMTFESLFDSFYIDEIEKTLNEAIPITPKMAKVINQNAKIKLAQAEQKNSKAFHEKNKISKESKNELAADGGPSPERIDSATTNWNRTKSAVNKAKVDYENSKQVKNVIGSGLSEEYQDKIIEILDNQKKRDDEATEKRINQLEAEKQKVIEQNEKNKEMIDSRKETLQNQEKEQTKEMTNEEATSFLEILGYDLLYEDFEKLCEVEKIKILERNTEDQKTVGPTSKEELKDMLINGASRNVLNFLLKLSPSLHSLDPKEVFIIQKMEKSPNVRRIISNLKGELRRKEPNRERLKNLKFQFRKEFFLFKQIEK